MGKAKQISVGDKVTCKVAEPAYSGYTGTEAIYFKPGMVGVVSKIAPKVRIVSGPGKDRRSEFLVVDYTAPETGGTVRVGLNFCNAVLVP